MKTYYATFCTTNGTRPCSRYEGTNKQALMKRVISACRECTYKGTRVGWRVYTEEMGKYAMLYPTIASGYIDENGHNHYLPSE